MLLAACLSSVALLGTWGTIQQAPTWAYELIQKMPTPILTARSDTLIWSSVGAIVGTILAALVAELLGRRITYSLLCLGSMIIIPTLFLASKPGDAWFFPVVFLSGAITASFYGWLPLYLPELFKTSIRATGQGFGFNFGRVIAAIGVLQLGNLKTLFENTSQVYALLAGIYVVGVILIWFAPETTGNPRPDLFIGSPSGRPAPEPINQEGNQPCIETQSGIKGYANGRISMHAYALYILAMVIGQAEPLGPGDHLRTLDIDKQKRNYLVHVPTAYQSGKKMPVVLAFAYACFMTAKVMEGFTGLNKKADDAGFIVVYPNGTGPNALLYTWNSGGFAPLIAQNKPNDVEFIAKVLDDVETTFTVDTKRIYATGMSNGAMMCYRLAAELSDRIAAIAPVSGTMAIEEYDPEVYDAGASYAGTVD